MKSIFKTTVEESLSLTFWGDSPLKSSKYSISRPYKKPLNSFKLKFSPYKESFKLAKAKAIRRCDNVLQDLVQDAPPKSRGFPKRKSVLTTKNIKKPFNRSQSCCDDKLSLLEIENIERLQKLVPNKQVYLSPRTREKIIQKQNSQLSQLFISSLQITRLTNYKNYT
ncbi:hypothetical protein SteCoe_16683 [Stentor coeruleus]|uniref:Uncharacterized protein n=1 Tax=Stentor coeruleus TaxID=5963 RepID=A0A1R2C0X2_9CILI|nr:hypothetical protein SteCoe_16683 [Stentor coeruleus]